MDDAKGRIALGTREKNHGARFTYSLEVLALGSNRMHEPLGDRFERFGWNERDEESATPRMQGARR